ncbi:MAG: BMP family lipoprotein [Bacilli bacterium]
MKRTIFILTSSLVLLLSACGNEKAEESKPETTKPKPSEQYVVYFDRNNPHSSLLSEDTYEVNEKEKVIAYSFRQVNSKSKSKINKETAGVYGIGVELKENMQNFQQEFKSVPFMLVGSDVPLNGVSSLALPEVESAFLAGLISAKQTKTKSVGLVLGKQTEQTLALEYAWKSGVQLGDKDVKMLVHYVGATNRPDLGEQGTAALIQRDADIFYSNAGETEKGMIAQIKREQGEGVNVWCVGNFFQYDEGGTVSSEFLVGIGYDLKKIFTQSRQFAWKEKQVHNVVDDTKRITIINGNEVLKSSTNDIVDKYIKKILSNEFTIPTTAETFDTFLKTQGN